MVMLRKPYSAVFADYRSHGFASRRNAEHQNGKSCQDDELIIPTRLEDVLQTETQSETRLQLGVWHVFHLPLQRGVHGPIL